MSSFSIIPLRSCHDRLKLFPRLQWVVKSDLIRMNRVASNTLYSSTRVICYLVCAHERWVRFETGHMCLCQHFKLQNQFVIFVLPMSQQAINGRPFFGKCRRVQYRIVFRLLFQSITPTTISTRIINPSPDCKLWVAVCRPYPVSSYLVVLYSEQEVVQKQKQSFAFFSGVFCDMSLRGRACKLPAITCRQGLG